MKSFEESLKLAEAGDKEWCYKVWECYELGNGVEQSFDKAFEWYKKAAYEFNNKKIYKEV